MESCDSHLESSTDSPKSIGEMAVETTDNMSLSNIAQPKIEKSLRKLHQDQNQILDDPCSGRAHARAASGRMPILRQMDLSERNGVQSFAPLSGLQTEP